MAARLTLQRVRRWAVLGGVVIVVSWAHLWVAARFVTHWQQVAASEPALSRIEVAYVRDMEAELPVRPGPARLPARQARRASVQPVTPAASAPPVKEELPAPAEEPAAEPVPASPPASVPASATASEPDAPPFEWPVSTRMRYTLVGDYRGEVHGHAQVEWIRTGSRYQVHLDVEVGLLASRRLSSDGDITSEGLAPRRYDQETKLPFQAPYRAAMRFEPERVFFSNGQSTPRHPQVQDTVSQFIQLTWLFATQPDRLRVGESVEVLLAMPRNQSRWVYDVASEERLYTPFGELQAFHLRPRREPQDGGDMVVDIWIAPQLRHLPVRFRIRPDETAYFDLMLDRRPELAAPEPEFESPRSPP